MRDCINPTFMLNYSFTFFCHQTCLDIFQVIFHVFNIPAGVFVFIFKLGVFRTFDVNGVDVQVDGQSVHVLDVFGSYVFRIVKKKIAFPDFSF